MKVLISLPVSLEEPFASSVEVWVLTSMFEDDWSLFEYGGAECSPSERPSDLREQESPKLLKYLLCAGGGVVNKSERAYRSAGPCG